MTSSNQQPTTTVAATVTSADVAALIKTQKPGVAVVDVRDQQVRQHYCWNVPRSQKNVPACSCTVSVQLHNSWYSKLKTMY